MVKNLSGKVRDFVFNIYAQIERDSNIYIQTKLGYNPNKEYLFYLTFRGIMYEGFMRPVLNNAKFNFIEVKNGRIFKRQNS